MRRRRWASPSTRTWSSNSRRRVPTKRSAKAFMFGVRTAVRTTLVPTASNRLANRAPSLASRSTTSTSGWMSKVAFRACCAHQSSDGARVTAACMILRLFRSRKNRTKIGRKSTSKVCTKSQAQVTWLRRKVLQRWPSLGTRFFMYRCTVDGDRGHEGNHCYAAGLPDPVDLRDHDPGARAVQGPEGDGLQELTRNGKGQTIIQLHGVGPWG